MKKGNLRDWTLLFVKRSGYQWIWATAEIQNDGLSCLLGQKGCVIADELKCLTTSVIGQWVTGGAGSVVKPAVHCTFANCVLCISSIWCLNKTKNKRNRSLVSGITSIWQEEDVQVWFWWRIKDERGEGIGLGAMRWQTKSNRPGYLLGSQVLRFNRKVRSGSDNNSFPVTVS